MEAPYKILSLDGGGSWAILQVLTLKAKYGNISGHQILREFDLVIANSGGSIVLAALAADWTLDEAIAIFDKEENRKKVFHTDSIWKKITKKLRFGPRYATSEKYKALCEIFGADKAVVKLPMDELPALIGKPSLRLVVCTFDAVHNKAKFFKSYRSPSAHSYDAVTLIEAIHGSSNAPVNYFDFPAQGKAKVSNADFYLWDGALGGFNNPVAAGLIEAIESAPITGINIQNIKIVSLGTGNKITSPSEKNRIAELLQKVGSKPLLALSFFFQTTLKLAQTILYEPPDWANYVAYVLQFKHNLGNPDNINQFVRLSPLLYAPKEADPKTIDLVNALYQLDMDLIKDEDIQLIKQCFTAWESGRLLNQPIKASMTANDELVCAIGHSTFQQALAHW